MQLPPSISKKISKRYPGCQDKKKLAKSLGISLYKLELEARRLGIYQACRAGRKVTARKPKGKHKTEKQKRQDKVRKLYPTCPDRRGLAASLGISYSTLRDDVRQMGLKRLVKTKWHFKEREERLQRILKEYSSAKTLATRNALAKDLGITAYHMNRVARTHGIYFFIGKDANTTHDAFLIANMGTMTSIQIAKAIGMGKTWVRDRFKALGISKPHPPRPNKKPPKPKPAGPRKQYPSDYKKLSPAELQKRKDERDQKRIAERELKIKVRQAAASQQASRKKAPVKLATLQRDPSKFRRVKADGRTWIEVPVGVDPQPYIDRYLANKPLNKLKTAA
ncbi:hypothetical protein SAMN05444008_102401 [Cnuella takakiae]|uniref:Uncharacterized protein n=1 Tax=Cnuella takakiae TaxID=1302690 RepID=A0A1M4VW01_9BACT|nr:hypothetical protein [Cnuella takakiae]OLY92481.1 hypothetical protein BUE76_11730 [Cnuella takakiae]SHE73085.1 hypothetical protein SAMN05444008_102401 [Cnuella takakiae]